MTTPADKKETKNSALYRVSTDVGFNARVEPMWYTYERLKNELGFFARRRLRKQIKNTLYGIASFLEKHKISAKGWEVVDGECVCNLRVAKIGLPSELQNYLKENCDDSQWAGWPHLMGQREKNALIIPVAFDKPFSVMIQGEKYRISSAPRLQKEINAVNTRFKIQETFALAKMTKFDFVDAKETDIARYESRFATLNDFWPKFAFVLTKKLADMSVERKFPVHFA